jgi:hypothetical protein
MGMLFYGGDTDPTELPDRVLAHVKAVVAAKLRRGESFTLSWRHDLDAPGGRSTIWVHPSIPLRFVFSKPEGETLDLEILRRFAQAAGSTSGLTIDLADFCDGEDSPTSVRPAPARTPVLV